MWKSFEGALEKRVRASKKAVVLDDYIVKKITNDVLLEEFGGSGSKYLEILSIDGGILKIKSEKSIWSSELLLRKEEILDKINQKLTKKYFKNLFVLG